MKTSAKLATCHVCHRPGRRVTNDGRIYRHQPWGTAFSGGMVNDCAGSGEPVGGRKKGTK